MFAVFADWACTAKIHTHENLWIVGVFSIMDSRLTVWRYSCMLMCACAKRLELRPTKIKSAKSFVMVHPSKYTRYTVCMCLQVYRYIGYLSRSSQKWQIPIPTTLFKEQEGESLEKVIHSFCLTVHAYMVLVYHLELAVPIIVTMLIYSWAVPSSSPVNTIIQLCWYVRTW